MTKRTNRRSRRNSSAPNSTQINSTNIQWQKWLFWGAVSVPAIGLALNVYYLYLNDSNQQGSQQDSQAGLLSQFSGIFNRVVPGLSAWYVWNQVNETKNVERHHKSSSIASNIKLNNRFTKELVEKELHSKKIGADIKAYKKDMKIFNKLVPKIITKIMGEDLFLRLSKVCPLSVDLTFSQYILEGAVSRAVATNDGFSIFFSATEFPIRDFLPNSFFSIFANELQHYQVYVANKILNSQQTDPIKQYLPAQDQAQRKEIYKIIEQSLKGLINGLSYEKIISNKSLAYYLKKILQQYNMGPSQRVKVWLNTQTWSDSRKTNYLYTLSNTIPWNKHYAAIDRNRQLYEQDSDMASIYAVLNDEERHYFNSWKKYHDNYLQDSFLQSDFQANYQM